MKRTFSADLFSDIQQSMCCYCPGCGARTSGNRKLPSSCLVRTRDVRLPSQAALDASLLPLSSIPNATQFLETVCSNLSALRGSSQTGRDQPQTNQEKDFPVQQPLPQAVMESDLDIYDTPAQQFSAPVWLASLQRSDPRSATGDYDLDRGFSDSSQTGDVISEHCPPAEAIFPMTTWSPLTRLKRRDVLLRSIATVSHADQNSPPPELPQFSDGVTGHVGFVFPERHVSQVRGMRQRLMEINAALTSKLQDDNDNLVILRTEHGELAEQLTSGRIALSAVQERLEEAAQNLAEISSQLAQVTSALKSEQELSQRQDSEMATNAAVQQRRIADMEAKYTRAKGKLYDQAELRTASEQRTEIERQSLIDKQRELTRRAQEEVAAAEEAQAEVARIEKDIEVTKQSLGDQRMARSRLERQQQRARTASDGITDVREQITQRDANIQLLRSRIEEARVNLSKTRAQYQQAEAERGSELAALRQQTDEIVQLRDSLLERDKEVTEIVGGQSTREQDIRSKISELTSQLRAERELLVSSQEENEQLQNSIFILKQRCSTQGTRDTPQGLGLPDTAGLISIFPPPTHYAQSFNYRPQLLPVPCTGIDQGPDLFAQNPDTPLPFHPLPSANSFPLWSGDATQFVPGGAPSQGFSLNSAPMGLPQQSFSSIPSDRTKTQAW